MTPIEPIGEELGELVVFAKDQPEYNPLPVRRTPDGVLTSRWQLTEEERRALIAGADLQLQVWTFNSPLQPVRLAVIGVPEAEA